MDHIAWIPSFWKSSLNGFKFFIVSVSVNFLLVNGKHFAKDTIECSKGKKWVISGTHFTSHTKKNCTIMNTVTCSGNPLTFSNANQDQNKFLLMPNSKKHPPKKKLKWNESVPEAWVIWLHPEMGLTNLLSKSTRILQVFYEGFHCIHL